METFSNFSLQTTTVSLNKSLHEFGNLAGEQCKCNSAVKFYGVFMSDSRLWFKYLDNLVPQSIACLNRHARLCKC